MKKLEEKSKELKWLHCNSCNRDTEHTRVEHYLRRVDFDEAPIWWIDGGSIWVCNGCKEITTEIYSIFSEDIGDHGEPAQKTEYFPERNIETLKVKDYINIPHKLEKTYQEIIGGYNKSFNLLCAIGLRALLEGIYCDKGISGRTLNDKIENASFIPENIRKNLHGFRFLGNEAAHELIEPSKEDIELAIYIIEDILNIVYDLDYRSRLMYDKTCRTSHSD